MNESRRAVEGKPAIDLIGDARCTGCSACINACERSALTLGCNPAGFYRPQVNWSKCAQCGVCSLKCPVVLEERGKLQRAPWSEPKAFAAHSCDESIHLASSSGGAFTELAKVILERGGVAVGCGWADNWTPMHVLARAAGELERLRGSKYVQSRVGGVLSDVAALCKNGVPVLFSGTPCQVAAVQGLLNEQEKVSLVTCEVVCHGVPSPKVFELYLKWLFAGENIAAYSFRAKTKGWKTVLARSTDSRTYEVPLATDPFGWLSLVYHLSLMEACFRCAFQSIPRVADITLGDFWGAPKELDDPRGVSLVLVNSPKGERLCLEAAASGSLELIPVELAIAVAKNPRATGGQWQVPWLRQFFLKDVARGWSFRWLFWKYYMPIRTAERIRGRLALTLNQIARRVHRT